MAASLLRLVFQLSIINGFYKWSCAGPASQASLCAAPEPSTWALMLARIGGIGLVFCHAKKHLGFTFARAIAG
jgi:hypothetical protein